MEGLADALALVQKTAQDAEALRKIWESPDGRSEVWRNGQKFQTLVRPIAARAHRVLSIEDLGAYARRLADPSSVVCWHWLDEVVLVLNDREDRRDRVSLPLILAKPYRMLRDQPADQPTWRDQREFCRWLRIDLALPREMVAVFRKVTCKSGQDRSASIHHGNERLGGEVMGEVMGVDELPEELNVPIPVYDMARLSTAHSVTCAVEIDLARPAFSLRPFPGELRIVETSAAQQVREQLIDALPDDMPVYWGAP